MTFYATWCYNRGAQMDVHDHAKQWNYDVWVIDDGVSDISNIRVYDKTRLELSSWRRNRGRR